jgi:peroxiredoxin
MKRNFCATLAAVVVITSAQFVCAEGTNKTDIIADVAAASTSLQEKFSSGKTTADDMADEQKAITTLIVKHQKSQNREQLARLYLMLARINAEALENDSRALAILNQVKRDFAGTKAAVDAGAMAGQLKPRLAAADAATPEGLEVGMRFPSFSETDVSGKPLSLAAYRGKVVLIDFWATWCGPCVAEIPNVIATYRKHQPAGFEVIGISLDSERDRLMKFTRTRGVTWPQFFDGGRWRNKLAVKYEVRAIPATYLLNKRGTIIGKQLRGKKLEEAVAKALAEN